MDEVEVVGRALVLGVVSGLGMRIVANQVSVPMTTARDWRRRFRVRAPALTAATVALAVYLDPTPVFLEGDAETTAIQALGAAWQRARGRFGDRIPRLWRFWNLISGGQALGTNRSPPATRRAGAGWMAPPCEKEVGMSSDPREAMAVLRYCIEAAATDPQLTPAERGQLVRELACQAYDHPDGSRYTHSRSTLDRWVRAHREQGLDGLRRPARADLGT